MITIDPIMTEHGLIEKMFIVIQKELTIINETDKLNSNFMNSSIDFLMIYLDRCHHGKEEEIFFKKLEKKELNISLKNLMNQLVEEHSRIKKIINELQKANSRYNQGYEEEVQSVAELMKSILDFYPDHIKNEEEGFFKQIINYFNKSEKRNIIKEISEFDKIILHEKYNNVIQNLENDSKKNTYKNNSKINSTSFYFFNELNL